MLLSFTDTETTGFDAYRNQVITLSSFVTDQDYNIITEFHGRFRPDGRKDIVWSDGAEKIHKITWEEAMEFPTLKDESERYIEWLRSIEDDLDFVAHNMAYDRRMIKGTLFRHDLHFPWQNKHRHYTDTIKLLKESSLDVGKSKSLGEVCKVLGIEHDHHDAKSDAFVLIKIHELSLKNKARSALA